MWFAHGRRFEWTPETDAEICRLRTEEGLSYRQIAELAPVRVSERTVRERCIELLGEEATIQRGPWTPELEEDICRMRRDMHMSYPEITAKLHAQGIDVHLSSVRERCLKLLGEEGARVPSKEVAWDPVDEEKLRYLREKLEWDLKPIAEELGMSVTKVWEKLQKMAIGDPGREPKRLSDPKLRELCRLRIEEKAGPKSISEQLNIKRKVVERECRKLGINKRTWPFEQAREWVHKNKPADTFRSWHKWAASKERPAEIPRRPDVAYAGQWEGWDDWLGLESPTVGARPWQILPTRKPPIPAWNEDSPIEVIAGDYRTRHGSDAIHLAVTREWYELPETVKLVSVGIAFDLISPFVEEYAGGRYAALFQQYATLLETAPYAGKTHQSMRETNPLFAELLSMHSVWVENRLWPNPQHLATLLNAVSSALAYDLSSAILFSLALWCDANLDPPPHFVADIGTVRVPYQRGYMARDQLSFRATLPDEEQDRTHVSRRYFFQSQRAVGIWWQEVENALATRAGARVQIEE